MLQDFNNLVNFSLTVGTVIENLAVALVCSLIIALFYKLTYRGPGYSVSFIHSLVVLSMITSIVIIVIGNNLARAFGLVGAMSIIRFRTAVKETMDIVYIFFSLVIGMAAGVGLHFIAICGTLLVGTILTLLTKTNFFSARKEKYLLQFNYLTLNGSDESPYSDVIKKFCKRSNILNVKSNGSNNGMELSYYIDLKDKNLNAKFVRELKAIDGVLNVNLYHDEESF
jgi:uncharacterized membrane protein YhiD involved in acid resistance